MAWLRRVIVAIRANWSRTQMLLSAGNHYCTPEVLRFSRADGHAVRRIATLDASTVPRADAGA